MKWARKLKNLISNNLAKLFMMVARGAIKLIGECLRAFSLYFRTAYGRAYTLIISSVYYRFKVTSPSDFITTLIKYLTGDK